MPVGASAPEIPPELRDDTELWEECIRMAKAAGAGDGPGELEVSARSVRTQALRSLRRTAP